MTVDAAQVGTRVLAALPVPQAAAALDLSVVQLRRLLRQGAPVARRGARGRGRATLVDVQAVRAWRASQHVTLAAASAAIPDVLADALAGSLEQSDGLPKQRLAAVMAGVWYAASVAVLDHLRRFDPGVADVTARPLAVERLLKIAGL